MQIASLKNKIASFSIKAVKRSFALFLLMFLCTGSYGQLFFYVTSKLHTPDNKPLTYEIFIKMDVYGSIASARTAFKDPVTGKSRVVKQNYVYNSFPNKSYIDNTVYMMPFGNALNEDGQPEKNFVTPRFQFNKPKTMALYDATVTVYYSFNNKDWFAPQSSSFKTIAYQDLIHQKTFVKEFYKENEHFYKDLFNIPTQRLTNAELKRNIFLIAVAATNDPEIGSTTQLDLQNVETFGYLSFSKFNFHYIEISGAAFTKNAVNAAIDKLRPGPEDAVIFYYSGHGFRYNEDVSAYPRMALVANPSQSPDEANLSLEDVYNSLLKKGAMATIVLADCCNDKYGAKPPVGPSPPEVEANQGTPPPMNPDNFRTLFIPKHPLHVLACAAEINQLAGGNQVLGGFFSNFIIAELQKSLFADNSIGDGESSWDMILNNTKEYTRRQALTAPCNDGPCYQGRCLQQPDFMVGAVSGIKTPQIKK